MVSRHDHHAPRASASAREHSAPLSPKLSNIDLNLLLVFDALYAERSVTRAGQRLNLSQSAVSHALSRLRDRLGDDLFVKSHDGMTPTLRARSVAPRVHAALAALQSALGDTPFDPSRSEHCFVVAADPYARAVLLPPLIARIRAEAPGIELRVRPGFAGVTDALDSGELDVAIARYAKVPERFGITDLLEDRLVWALREDHPAAAAPLTLEALASLPYVTRIAPSDEGTGDDLPALGRGLIRRAMQDDDGALTRALAGVGLRNSTRWTVPDSITALATVSASDLASLVPARLAQLFAAQFRLRLFDPPYPSPVVHLSMLWEPGAGDSPAARWLRQRIEDVAATLG